MAHTNGPETLNKEGARRERISNNIVHTCLFSVLCSHRPITMFWSQRYNYNLSYLQEKHNGIFCKNFNCIQICQNLHQNTGQLFETPYILQQSVVWEQPAGSSSVMLGISRHQVVRIILSRLLYRLSTEPNIFSR